MQLWLIWGNTLALHGKCEEMAEAHILIRHFHSLWYYLLGVGDEILSGGSKNYQLFFGGGLGLEVEKLRTAKRVIWYFMLNLMM